MRRAAKESTVLVLQDTTELDFTSKRKKNRDAGPLNYEDRVGFYLHPSMVVTPEGLHLGTVDAKLWSRDEADFGKQVDRKKRPFEEKESARWRDGYRVSCDVAKACPNTTVVNVADRESDIYEYLVEAVGDPTENSHFIVRAAANRSLTEKDEAATACTYVKMRDRLEASMVLCEISIKVPHRGNRKAREATLEIRSGTVELKPPHRCDGRLPKLKVNVVWAREKDAPPDEAQKVLSYYAMRWQIRKKKTPKKRLRVWATCYKLSPPLAATSVANVTAPPARSPYGSASTASPTSPSPGTPSDQITSNSITKTLAIPILVCNTQG